MKTFFTLLRKAFEEFQQDRGPRIAAALSYYTIFSLAPLLIIVTAVAGLFFGQEAARGELFHQLNQLVGDEGARFIEQLIARTERLSSNLAAMGIGFGVLMYGASKLFVQLQDALNTMWGIPPKKGQGWKIFVKKRLFSFAMVLGIGFLLLVSLVLSAVVAGVHRLLSKTFPFQILLSSGDLVLGFIVVTLLFAMIFKVLPDARVRWKDVWVGALMTSLFFSCGRFLIGLYLGNAAVTSSFGAAGSLIVLLMWFNYSAQIMLFGSEFTHVLAEHRGYRIVPRESDT